MMFVTLDNFLDPLVSKMFDELTICVYCASYSIAPPLLAVAIIMVASAVTSPTLVMLLLLRLL